MRISEMFANKKPVFSLEIFPPKKQANIDTIYETVAELAALKPDFISVTFSAGGSGNGGFACDIASKIKEMGITPVDYITFAKMRRAVTKLLKTKNTVAQISCDLSFSSPKYFTRIFKECFGVSPQKFRCGEISEKEMYYLKKGVTK